MAGSETQGWLDLAGRTAVVTGAGGGIGHGAALELARAGVRTFVIDLDADSAASSAAAIQDATGVESVSFACDTRDETKLAEAGRALTEQFGDADILVNNAGVVGRGSLLDVDMNDWQRVLDVNLSGYLLCVREFGRSMVRRGSGSIVHVSSICGINPAKGMGAYSASKAAVAMLNRQLALELAPSGVRSNAVAPGLIRTPLSEATYRDDAARSARERSVPLARIGTPQDIANTVVWLSSPRSSYVTGQEILVDGGVDQTLMSTVRSSDR
ncbi:SDR family oxidoreductase [Rhodococcus sp. 06-156-3C]|uniref:SDR family NAD(P)-dependent oxidoreductase n=1 Tax=Nocardiaceae TaxID=85025 RepID=UPI000522EFCD|nr:MULTISPECIES: SDR family oxidoreductase [Rhodococcus]OZD13063.1 SDR family oxidoreductase [Rhodococcus sp. 06-156-4a]OZD17932.1 SDR family oxidoreductase [Rhodococcus sp. 06-156-3C]OZD20656.1 SDR family oxidoreductase [Rhodococcus sp. 06-156-4C]OZD30626.1 SDR family oxidoreductase [Rhodococcus sp. 06-156-3b]OZD32602.1 SDR family oxidoreductase [Rhodococcus sp. 06-156-3]